MIELRIESKEITDKRDKSGNLIAVNHRTEYVEAKSLIDYAIKKFRELRKEKISYASLTDYDGWYSISVSKKETLLIVEIHTAR